MKENAILVRQLDIIKVYVDFSDFNNIYKVLNVKHVSTIHTEKTQNISRLLGIHLMGYVDREGHDINNKKACEITGYDYLGSFLLLFKTDDKFNALPLEENELECVFTFLTTGKVIPTQKEEGLEGFNERYGLNPLLPNIGITPRVHFKEHVPYVALLEYDLRSVPENKLEKVGEGLFQYSSLLISSFKEVEDVRLSPDEKYYVKCKTSMEHGCFYVLIQAKDVEDVDAILINNIDAVIDGILGRNEKQEEHLDMEDTMEEAMD